MLHGIVLGHIARLGADDDAEFHFPVGFLAAAGNAHVIVGALERTQRLHEDDGLLGDRRTRLGRMVGVVQADADEVDRARHAGAHARAALHLRQRHGIDGGQTRKARRRQRAGVDLVQLGRQVAQRTVSGQQGGFLGAGGADT
jgi:hypothetical protein